MSLNNKLSILFIDNVISVILKFLGDKNLINCLSSCKYFYDFKDYIEIFDISNVTIKFKHILNLIKYVRALPNIKILRVPMLDSIEYQKILYYNNSFTYNTDLEELDLSSIIIMKNYYNKIHSELLSDLNKFFNSSS